MNKRLLLSALLATLSAAVVLGCAPSEAAPPSVTVEEARSAVAAGRAVLIDIREPDEQAQGVAPGARLLPMSQLGARMSEIPSDPTHAVLLVCNTQNRSRATLAQLQSQPGYGHLRYVQGGMSEWVRRGLPLVQPAP